MKNTGRRAAKVKAKADRPDLVLAMITDKPMLAADISKAIGLADSKTAGRVLTILKRAGKARTIVVGRNDWWWVAIGSKAEADTLEQQKLRAEDREEARRERKRKRADNDAYRQRKAEQRLEKIEADYQAWLYPVKRLLAVGEWQVQVPKGAIRSVFEMV